MNSIAIKFQGGFAARRFVIEYRQQDGSFATISEFFPDDHGKLQISFSFVYYFHMLKIELCLSLVSLTLGKHLSSSNSSND